MSQQAVPADTIRNSAVGIFPPKNGRNKRQRQLGAHKLVTMQFRSLCFAHLATLKSSNSKRQRRIRSSRKVQLGPDKQRAKTWIVWRNRKKISQIINYLYLPFFLLIILWARDTKI
jgi:hypothetical protein